MKRLGQLKQRQMERENVAVASKGDVMRQNKIKSYE